MKTNLNTLYNIIVKVARERDEIPAIDENARNVAAKLGEWTPEQIAEHKADEIQLWNMKNRIVADTAAEYQARGGKRDVAQFVKADR